MLKIHGHLCAMQDVSDTYTSAPDVKQIAPKNMVRSKADPKAANLRKKLEEDMPGSSNIADY